MRCYLGNIPFTATTDDVKAFLAPYAVREVRIIMDRETGRPRGFAFAQMESVEDMRNAIANRHGQMFGNRAATVSEAHERAPRSR